MRNERGRNADPAESVVGRRAVLASTAQVGLGTTLAATAGTAQRGDRSRLQWRFEPGGGAPSSPTIVDGTVYLTDGHSVYAVDAASGEERWRFVPPTAGMQGADSEDAVAISGVYGHPLVVDGTVYVSGQRSVVLREEDGRAMQPISVSRSLFALDAESGELRDEREAPLAFVPVGAGETSYFPSGDGVVAVGPDLGRAGEAAVPARATRSPAIGEGLLVVPTRGGLVALGAVS